MAGRARDQAGCAAATVRSGYAPVTTYADAVRLTCDGLVSAASDGDWRHRFPGSRVNQGCLIIAPKIAFWRLEQD